MFREKTERTSMLVRGKISEGENRRIHLAVHFQVRAIFPG